MISNKGTNSLNINKQTIKKSPWTLSNQSLFDVYYILQFFIYKNYSKFRHIDIFEKRSIIIFYIWHIA